MHLCLAANWNISLLMHGFCNNGMHHKAIRTRTVLSAAHASRLKIICAYLHGCIGGGCSLHLDGSQIDHEDVWSVLMCHHYNVLSCYFGFFFCLFAWNLISKCSKHNTLVQLDCDSFTAKQKLSFEQLGRHSWKVFLRKRFNRATEAVSVHPRTGLAVIISAFGMTSFDAWTKGTPPAAKPVPSSCINSVTCCCLIADILMPGSSDISPVKSQLQIYVRVCVSALTHTCDG